MKMDNTIIYDNKKDLKRAKDAVGKRIKRRFANQTPVRDIVDHILETNSWNLLSDANRGVVERLAADANLGIDELYQLPNHMHADRVRLLNERASRRDRHERNAINNRGGIAALQQRRWKSASGKPEERLRMIQDGEVDPANLTNIQRLNWVRLRDNPPHVHEIEWRRARTLGNRLKLLRRENNPVKLENLSDALRDGWDRQLDNDRRINRAIDEMQERQREANLVVRQATDRVTVEGITTLMTLHPTDLDGEDVPILVFNDRMLDQLTNGVVEVVGKLGDSNRYRVYIHARIRLLRPDGTTYESYIRSFLSKTFENHERANIHERVRQEFQHEFDKALDNVPTDSSGSIILGATQVTIRAHYAPEVRAERHFEIPDKLGLYPKKTFFNPTNNDNLCLLWAIYTKLAVENHGNCWGYLGAKMDKQSKVMRSGPTSVVRFHRFMARYIPSVSLTKRDDGDYDIYLTKGEGQMVDMSENSGVDMLCSAIVGDLQEDSDRPIDIEIHNFEYGVKGNKHGRRLNTTRMTTLTTQRAVKSAMIIDIFRVIRNEWVKDADTTGEPGHYVLCNNLGPTLNRRSSETNSVKVILCRLCRTHLNTKKARGREDGSLRVTAEELYDKHECTIEERDNPSAKMKLVFGTAANSTTEETIPRGFDVQFQDIGKLQNHPLVIVYDFETLQGALTDRNTRKTEGTTPDFNAVPYELTFHVKYMDDDEDQTWLTDRVLKPLGLGKLVHITDENPDKFVNKFLAMAWRINRKFNVEYNTNPRGYKYLSSTVREQYWDHRTHTEDSASIKDMACDFCDKTHKQQRDSDWYERDRRAYVEELKRDGQDIDKYITKAELVVEHDHSVKDQYGSIRGLACYSCNNKMRVSSDVNIYAHNSSNFDTHLIMQRFDPELIYDEIGDDRAFDPLTGDDWLERNPGPLAVRMEKYARYLRHVRILSRLNMQYVPEDALTPEFMLERALRAIPRGFPLGVEDMDSDVTMAEFEDAVRHTLGKFDKNDPEHYDESLNKQRIMRIIARKDDNMHKSKEKILSIRFMGCLVVRDTASFVAASLKDFVESTFKGMPDDEILRSMKDIIEYYPQLGRLSTSDRLGIVRSKGSFPYRFVKDYSDLSFPAIPSSEFFDGPNRVEDRESAVRIFDQLGFKTLAEYSKFYCLLDTNLLSAALNKIRQLLKDMTSVWFNIDAPRKSGLDLANYMTLAGYAYNTMLTGHRVHNGNRSMRAPDEQESYDFINESIIGGISHTYRSRMYSADADENKLLTMGLMDINSQYPSAMVKTLPLCQKGPVKSYEEGEYSVRNFLRDLWKSEDSDHLFRVNIRVAKDVDEWEGWLKANGVRGSGLHGVRRMRRVVDEQFEGDLIDCLSVHPPLVQSTPIKLDELSQYSKDLIAYTDLKTGEVKHRYDGNNPKLLISFKPAQDYVAWSHYLKALVFKYGYIVDSVSQRLDFVTGKHMTNTIDYLYQQRLDYKVKGMTTHEFVVKIILNSIYGRLLMRMDNKNLNRTFFDFNNGEPDTKQRFINSLSTVRYREHEIIDPKTVLVTSNKREAKVKTVPHVGSAVLAHTKVDMLDAIYAMRFSQGRDFNIYYMDTDSIMYTLPTGCFKELVEDAGDHLDIKSFKGSTLIADCDKEEFDDEYFDRQPSKPLGKLALEEDNIQEAVCLRPKLYSFKRANDDHKVRSKGVNVNNGQLAINNGRIRADECTKDELMAYIFEEMKNSLLTTKEVDAEYFGFVRDNSTLTGVTQRKGFISPFCDKLLVPNADKPWECQWR